MKEEYNQNKIYKNLNPSSILDFVGKHLPSNNAQIMNFPLLNYTRKAGSFYTKQKFESNTSPRMTMLNTVFEKFKKDEVSSSLDSSLKEGDNSIKRNENTFKPYRSVNVNFKLNNNNINRRISDSSNILYNYKSYKKILKNKYYPNISWINENNIEKYNAFTNDKYSSNEMSMSFRSSFDEDKSEFFLNKKESYNEKEEKEKSQKETNIEQKIINLKKKRKEIKKKFYLLVSIFYFSLYLLNLKISLRLSMPNIPSLGVSSFIINFYNLLISLIFMKLDQIELKEYLYFDKIGNYFLKIVVNYIKILLTIKSLQHLKLFTFILILNTNPLLGSYIAIKENNKSFIPSDLFYYSIFFFIMIIEFLEYNKISVICIIILMILNTFIAFTKITIIKNVHSYIIDFGSSLIGIAISPILMSINKNSLNISFSQHLLFTIISFSYFLNHYFENKYAYYSLGQEYHICSNVIIVCLYVLYSNFLLREYNNLKSYTILIFSLVINIYGKFRIENSGI